jgi:hypothetical protein
MPRCQIFSFADNLTEVVPNGLHMASLVGETMSIGVVKYTEAGAGGLETKAHAHGEEASFQIQGSCELYLGTINAPTTDEAHMAPGTLVIIPADQMHYGVNGYGPEGVSLRLNVASPPRAEYGSKDKPKVFSHQARDEK